MQKQLKWAGAISGAAAMILGISMLSSNQVVAENVALGSRTYEVTITNLTRAQIFSPPVVASHNSTASIFRSGTAASAELAELAENGNNVPLINSLGANADVLSIDSAAAGVMPGGSVTLTVTADRVHNLISAAGMLVSTNDAFFGLDSATCVPSKRSITLFVPAYDSGTEFNSEDCAFVPGPPCNAGAVHDPTPAEGYIYVNNGIQGIGGVTKETYDWRNPVARIVITQI